MDPLRPSIEDALAAWAGRVRANREQVERLREVRDGTDRYAPVASMFRTDPHRTDEPLLDVLRSLARPDETWLDIGAGGGRYALPLALCTREVIALDPSQGMLGVLREGIEEHEIPNVRVVEARWPAAEALRADVAFIAHVGYDVEEIGPFLDAMEGAASRLCIAVLLDRPPPWTIDQLWPAVHGEPRAALPALPEFLVLHVARGRTFEVRLADVTSPTYDRVESALGFARHQTWVQPDGEKDHRLRAALAEHLIERDGRLSFSREPIPVGVVTWTPTDAEPR